MMLQDLLRPAADDHDLLSGGFDDQYDDVTCMVQRQSGAQVALFSVIDDARGVQYFKSLQGLAEPWRGLRESPLSHSFCRIVRDTAAPLVVEDAREDPRLCDHPAIGELGIVSYAGFPVFGPDGRALGALCAAENGPRGWPEATRALIGSLARLLSRHVGLRAELDGTSRALCAAERRCEAESAVLTRLERRVREPVHALRGMIAVLADARMGRDCRETLARLGESVELLDERLLEWRAMREAAGTVSEFAGSIAPVSEILARLGERHDRRRVRFDVEGDARSRHADAERLLLLVNQIVEHLGRTAPKGRVTVRVDCRSRESLALSVLDPGTDRVDGHLGNSLQGFLHDRAAGDGADELVSVNLDFARRLAARMGGSISLESAAGEGTRIDIRLPMAPPDQGGRPVPGRRRGGAGIG